MLPSGRLELIALKGLPIISAGDDLATLILQALKLQQLNIEPDDILVITSKVVSKAEGRFVDLSQVIPSPEGRAIARQVDKDPRLVSLILKESTKISRKTKGALIVQHRLGFVSANAGIDQSNVLPKSAENHGGPFALLLPSDPDNSAKKIREALFRELGVKPAIIISDSFGRPFRVGTVGVALGVSGISPLSDQRGQKDLFGRTMEHTITAVADQIACAADLVAGQAAEARPVVLVRGLQLSANERASAKELCRSSEHDLYL